MLNWRTSTVGVYDLILLDEISENAMFDNIAKRTKAQEIYVCFLIKKKRNQIHFFIIIFF